MLSRLHFVTPAIVALLCVLTAIHAQAQNEASPSFVEPAASVESTPENSTATVTVTPPAKASANPALGHGLDRWLELGAFNYGNRYRGIVDANGAHTFDQGQQKLIADGRFKFDEQGRYGLGFHLSSGRYFNWAYAEFIGGGMHDFVAKTVEKMNPMVAGFLQSTIPEGFFNSGGGQVYLRQAFLFAEPVRGVEVQFGGFGINHGVNTEATSYDDDGYMSGERISVRRPKQLYFSELSYTRGYLGDLYEPNFFARGYRLSAPNYWQILGRKDFGSRIAVSADYTATAPAGAPLLKTTREAIYGNIHESKVFDTVRLEAYQRLNTVEIFPGFVWHDAKGYAFTVTRNFKKHAAFEAGIADIDPFYITYLGASGPAAVLALTVNGDQYGVGRRYFTRVSVPITSSMSLTGYYSHIFDYTAPDHIQDMWNAQAVNAGLVIDAKKLFFPQHAH